MTDVRSDRDEFTDVWKDEDTAPTDLESFRAELKRRRRRRAWVVFMEIVVTFGLLWLTRWLLVPGAAIDSQVIVEGGTTVQVPGRDVSGVSAALVAGVWIFWLVATCFAWWNRRGQFRMDVASVEEFAQLSLVSAQRKLNLVWFALGLMVAEVVFIVTIRVMDGAGPVGSGWVRPLLTIGAVVVAYLGWGVWYYRRARLEQRHYIALDEATGRGFTACE